ncbi:transferrin-binding protein-like solute binding protein [Ursidibacter arcticus]
MKNAKLSLLALLAISLTACGGGGGSGTAKTPDGEKINLTLSPKGFVEAKTTYGLFKGQNNDSSFYGVWINDGKTLQEIRYQGTEATNLPRGSVTYIGDAVWVDGITKEVKKGGSTLLNVDFDNKTVDGKIAFSALRDDRSRDITLHKTNLSGSSFEGKASVLFNDTGTHKGGLFGEGAKEAAGIVEFKDATLNLDTSFGGKR